MVPTAKVLAFVKALVGNVAWLLRPRLPWPIARRLLARRIKADLASPYKQAVAMEQMSYLLSDVAGPAEIEREKFLLGMVQTMVDEADLFGPKQLDEPMRLKMLCVEAQEALKQVPASKDTKVLDEKIQKLLKTIKTT